MLKKISNKILKIKIFELKLTPGEQVRDFIFETGMKTAKESAYLAGNNTDKLIKVSERIGSVVDRGTELIGGAEASTALGKIIFKTTKDVGRGDRVCTGLCVVSAACEAVAVGCSTLKILPGRGRIYVGAKVISRGCMAFRNACAGEGC
jgi:hypothetical protein